MSEEIRPDTGRKAKRGRPKVPWSVREMALRFEGKAHEEHRVQPKQASTSRRGYSKSNLHRLLQWDQLHKEYPWMGRHEWMVSRTLKIRALLLYLSHAERKRTMKALGRAVDRNPDMTASEAVAFMWKRIHAAYAKHK